MAQPGGLAHQFIDQFVEATLRGSLRDDRQDAIATIAIRKILIGSEHLWMTFEYSKKRLWRVQLMDRHVDDIVVDGCCRIFIEVVADSRPVCKKMLNCDRVVDERKIAAEDRTNGSVEREDPLFNESHHRQSCESFCHAGYAETVAEVFAVSAARYANPYAELRSVESRWSRRMAPEKSDAIARLSMSVTSWCTDRA